MLLFGRDWLLSAPKGHQHRAHAKGEPPCRTSRTSIDVSVTAPRRRWHAEQRRSIRLKLWSVHRHKAREALQEAVFALQITHARTSIVIGKIENPENRKQLQAQSTRIGTLIDLAWCRLGDI
ncbi:hypothetical protein [Bradyrhizobium sp. JR3.5]